MNYRFLLTFLMCTMLPLLMEASSTSVASQACTYKLRKSADADWVIVGAGVAGIATLGVLLDIGVPPERVTWIDPEFNVGRMGEFYTHVPSNNKTIEFIEFVTACKAFQDAACPAIDYLKQLDPNERHTLSVVTEPLKCITDQLCTRVVSLQDKIISLHFNDDVWHVGTQQGKMVTANHVVLAIGAHPKTLTYETNKIIPLDCALNPVMLAQYISPDDIIGVVGGSHSAILILKFLSEMSVKHIYNFYRTPLQYTIDMGGWTLNQFTGLKGSVATWAQNVLEKNPPANLTRIHIEDTTLETLLPQCTKVIYAIGYERNDMPSINNGAPISSYNDTNGFIAPRLFGIGIAFPELTHDHAGDPHHRIGLDSFMEYAQRLVPQWATDEIFKAHFVQAKAQLHELKKAAALFEIYSL
jgi:hypothetical protein